MDELLKKKLQLQKPKIWLLVCLFFTVGQFNMRAHGENLKQAMW